ncbi:MAG: chorismate-binding protein [Flavobacteriaceae bacterium]|jgi:isochorismate synthase|nr:chorismate-binding protein [Flavobacteriaceae bacterium]
MFFETIQNQFKNQLPFVAYRKPNSFELKVFFQKNDTVHYVENYDEVGFVFAPFDDSHKSVLIPLEFSDKIETSYNAKDVLKSNNIDYTFNKEDKEQHIQLVEKGINSIKNNVFQKVVLSRMEAVTFSEFNLINIFKNLLNKYPLAFVYCWYHPKIGLWLGATPETLMKIEGNQFSMMSLAGTQEYKETLNVLWEEKEQKEQQIVTDFITESLEPLVENLKVSEVETVKAGNLVHLKTIIKANLKLETFHLKHILPVLHPTPAVCGMPKSEAKMFILKNESYNREFYTGYLGELNFETKMNSKSSKRNIENRAYTITKKSTQLYVNLRCMQIKNNMALIYVGGGITEASNAEKEWEETVSKSKVIKNIL